MVRCVLLCFFGGLAIAGTDDRGDDGREGRLIKVDDGGRIRIGVNCRSVWFDRKG